MANALQFDAPPDARMMPVPGSPTNPAPAPARQNALSPVPMMAQPRPKQQQPNMLASAFKSFARGFAPEQVKASDERTKAEAGERTKKALVWMQQTAAQPLEKRAQFTQQYAQQIAADTGQPVEAIMQSAQDPNGFTDEAISQGVAALSAQLGQGPAAPDYQFLQGPDGAISLGNKGTGQVQQVQPGTPKPKNPIIIGNNAYDPETYEPIIQGEAKPNLPDGWQMGENGPEPIPGYAEWYRKMHPGDGSGSGSQFVDVPPAEMEALGYPKGTLGKRNTKTNELQVTSRPSTQMTGQPTESERKYAFYTKNAKHGLDVVNSMETQQGFNRADGWTWATSWTNQDARKYDQGMSQFIDSWLRAMTGAAATPSEIEFYKQQWTPQLGDGPDVIKQKRDARNQAVVDLQAAAGRGIPQGTSYAPTNVEPTASAPTFPDGTPITPETLQQLPPELRQVWARKLPTQQPDPTEDSFIDGLFPQDAGGDQVPDGVDPQDWQYMTPEERALFQ